MSTGCELTRLYYIIKNRLREINRFLSFRYLDVGFCDFIKMSSYYLTIWSLQYLEVHCSHINVFRQSFADRSYHGRFEPVVSQIYLIVYEHVS